MQTFFNRIPNSTQAIHNALANTLFPRSFVEPEAPPDGLADTFAGSDWLQHGYRGLLWGIEAHAMVTCGTRFSRMDLPARTRYLSENQAHPLIGRWLALASVPLKYRYLCDSPEGERLDGPRGLRVPSEMERQRWQQQVMDASEFEPEEAFEVDVVVIGTGAGGAAAAYELASRGLAVLILEEGHYYARKDFTGPLPERVRKLYRANGMTGAIGSTLIPIPVGCNVGGTTTINSGTCVRPPDSVLADWRNEGLKDFSPEAMAPYFERVEAILQVQPADARYVGEIQQVIKTGARQVLKNEGHVLHRNAVGCDGQGVCQFGCPTGAKQSTNVSFIPRALEAGALLLTGFRAQEILWEGSQVVGVRATGRVDPTGKPVPLTVKSRQVVVAMGSLLTPLFLKKNGIKNRQLGRNLSIHPAGAVMARFADRTFTHADCIPQGYAVTSLAERGILFEGATPPKMAYGLLLPTLGEAFLADLAAYENTAFFGFMIKDSSRGRVRTGLKSDLPWVTYSLNKTDFDRFLEGVSTLVRCYLASGATEVRIAGCRKQPVIRSEVDLQALLRQRLRPRDFLVSAFHPLGTARIGVSADVGVCDESHQVFGKRGLYVMDGSAVPTSLGANPQVTIMAMATRAAEALANRIIHEAEENHAH